jgi:hypothetical protein
MSYPSNLELPANVIADSLERRPNADMVMPAQSDPESSAL